MFSNSLLTQFNQHMMPSYVKCRRSATTVCASFYACHSSLTQLNKRWHKWLRLSIEQTVCIPSFVVECS